jgi:hypothetical protein
LLRQIYSRRVALRCSFATFTPIWTDNWHEHQLDFPAVVVLPDELGIRVVLTTQGLKPRYSRS